MSAVIGGLVCIQLSYDRLVHQKYLSDRPLLFLGVSLIIVGIQFMSIGLLGEMITETHSRDSSYSIRSQIGLGA